MSQIVLRTPVRINVKHISELLYILSYVYKKNPKNLSGFVLDLTATREINLLGVLIVCKFMEYTIEKECFRLPEVIINIDNDSDPMYVKIKHFGFHDFFNKLLSNKPISENKFKIDFLEKDNFIMSPQVLVRDNHETRERLATKYLPKVKEYYKDDKVVSMIFHCLSEIMLNFWAHATGDKRSIVVAAGNREFIEICCIDNGKGIISNLTSVYSCKKDRLICKAVEKGVTSKKKSNHMGRGLWIIDQISCLSGGEFYISSEGFYYHNNQAKTIVGNTGYWKGSIFYLNLRIDKPVVPSDFMEIDKKLQINFVKL